MERELYYPGEGINALVEDGLIQAMEGDAARGT
jgi:hypothetical protein